MHNPEPPTTVREQPTPTPESTSADAEEPGAAGVTEAGGAGVTELSAASATEAGVTELGAAAAAEAGSVVAARPVGVRKADTLAKLAAPVADAWVATTGSGGPYLIPLTMAWTRGRIILATGRSSRTTTNLAATGVARVALGPTRDVVMIDALGEAVLPVAEAPPWVAEGYAAQSDWDPRDYGGEYVYLLLRPDRIQAWREENELRDRTLMRNGTWLV